MVSDITGTTHDGITVEAKCVCNYFRVTGGLITYFANSHDSRCRSAPATGKRGSHRRRPPLSAGLRWPARTSSELP
ncbi:hypothetical protein ACRAWF_12330 [Streptomyces sp. L7]